MCLLWLSRTKLTANLARLCCTTTHRSTQKVLSFKLGSSTCCPLRILPTIWTRILPQAVVYRLIPLCTNFGAISMIHRWTSLTKQAYWLMPHFFREFLSQKQVWTQIRERRRRKRRKIGLIQRNLTFSIHNSISKEIHGGRNLQGNCKSPSRISI